MAVVATEPGCPPVKNPAPLVDIVSPGGMTDDKGLLVLLIEVFGVLLLVLLSVPPLVLAFRLLLLLLLLLFFRLEAFSSFNRRVRCDFMCFRR